MKKKSKVVTIGAGTGQANLISALLQYSELVITAIVNVTDNGGHTGILRKKLNIPAVGDLRQCLIAASPPSSLKDTYGYRNNLGYSQGNEILAQGILKEGSLLMAIERAAKELKSKATILPVTNQVVDIAAVLENNDKVVGEWNIIEREPRTPIKEMYLDPIVEALPEAILEIQSADYIVIGPGSLRTGIVSCLLPKGMRQAIRETCAIKILVINLMTHPGQTDGFSVAMHIDEFACYADCYPDFVLINNGIISQRTIEHYNSIGSIQVVGEVGVNFIKRIGSDFIPRANNTLLYQERVGNFKKWTHALVHDGPKLAETIMKIIKGYST